MTKLEFARKVKEKYPQYQNVDDATLADQVLAKYPEYNSQIEPEGFFKEKNAGQTGAKVLNSLTSGTQEFGKDIGQAFAANYAQKKLDEGQRNKDIAIQHTIELIHEKQKKGEDVTRLKKVLAEVSGFDAAKIDEIIPVINKTNKQILGDAASTVLEATAGGGFEAAKGAAVAKNLSKAQKVAKASLIGLEYGGVGSAANAMQENKSTEDIVKDAVTGSLTGAVVGAGIGTLGVGLEALITGKATAALNRQAPKIMNRVARLNPSDAAKFEKMTGMTHGEYLTKSGNFNRPDKIIAKEAEKFTASLKSVDDALASLPGNYQDGSITDALTGLAKRAQQTSGANVKSPYLREVMNLIKKHETQGLTMEEINLVKRLYERNVKLSYNKLVNADKVEKATNIDNALRKWQFAKAEELGLTNLPELNKQTQISKFIIDKLGKKLIGEAGNNAVSLTDWIMLSGGEPHSVAGLLTKKFFGSKTVQARIARILAAKQTIKQVTAKVTPTMENQLRKVYPKGVPLQLPEGTKGAKGKFPGVNKDVIALPTSARETNLGLDEVKNAKINTTKKPGPKKKAKPSTKPK